MFSLSRLVVTLAAVVGVTASVSQTVPAITGSISKGCWTFVESNSEIDRAIKRREELALRDKGLMARIDAKRKVVDELLNEKIDLLEAATRFQQISVQPPDFNWKSFRGAYEGQTDLERFCRQVIAHCEISLQYKPENAKRVEELREQLGSIVSCERVS